MQKPDQILPPRPPFWWRTSIPVGNLLQLVGLLLGAGFLFWAAHSSYSHLVRILLMLSGWLLIYICCHAIAHWGIGRLVGIEFQGYGLRGTDHPENYPIGLRQLMGLFPTFTVLTRKESMRQASGIAKALMFAAGESSTAVFSILAGLYAWQSGVPGGRLLFWIMVIFNLLSTIITAVVPRGDYAKAWRALHSPKPE